MVLRNGTIQIFFANAYHVINALPVRYFMLGMINFSCFARVRLQHVRYDSSFSLCLCKGYPSSMTNLPLRILIEVYNLSYCIGEGFKNK